MKDYLIFYDISQNKTRNLVVKTLKAYGFYRIQKSVFMGATKPELISDLKQLFEMLLQGDEAESDSYIIIKLSADNLKQIKLLNLSIDLEFITGHKTVIFI